MENIVFYPITMFSLETVIVLVGEQPKLFQDKQVYVLAPPAIYEEREDAGYLLNEQLKSGIKVIGEEKLCEYEPKSIFVELCEKDTEVKKFGDRVKEQIVRNGGTTCSLAEFCSKAKKESDWRKLIENPGSEETKAILEMYELKRPTVPIIGVGSLYHQLHTARIASNIRNTLKENRISVIYAGDLLYEAGIHSFPVERMQGISFDDRIRIVNFMINQVIDEEKPEALIIEIPGGIMKMDEKNLNGSGEYSYIYTSAVDIDYYICSVFLNGCKVKMRYDKITDFLERKYSLRKTAYHLSNMYLSPMRTVEHDRIPYVLVDSAYVNDVAREAKEQQIPAYNFLSCEEVKSWYQNL